MIQKVPYLEPKTVTEALKDKGWTNDMEEEIENCAMTNTWYLIPYTPDLHVLGCKWVSEPNLRQMTLWTS